MTPPSDQHLRGLLEIRTAIAAFEHAGERDARKLGLTHVQHHALLAVRADTHDVGPRVGDLAKVLSIASPTAVELIARMVAGGLLTRVPDQEDRRSSRLRVTPRGERLMTKLSEQHLPQLRDLTHRGAELLED